MTFCWLQFFIPFPPIFTDFTCISCSFSLTSITWHISSLSLKNIQRDVNKIHFTYLLNHTGGYLLAYYPNSNLFLNLLKISLEFFESISTIMVWDLSFFFKQCEFKFWSSYAMRSLPFTRQLLVITKPFQLIPWLHLSQHNAVPK